MANIMEMFKQQVLQCKLKLTCFVTFASIL